MRNFFLCVGLGLRVLEEVKGVISLNADLIVFHRHKIANSFIFLHY